MSGFWNICPFLKYNPFMCSTQHSSFVGFGSYCKLNWGGGEWVSCKWGAGRVAWLQLWGNIFWYANFDRFLHKSMQILIDSLHKNQHSKRETFYVFWINTRNAKQQKMVKLEILKAILRTTNPLDQSTERCCCYKIILKFRLHNCSHATVGSKNGTNKRIYKRS